MHFSCKSTGWKRKKVGRAEPGTDYEKAAVRTAGESQVPAGHCLLWGQTLTPRFWAVGAPPVSQPQSEGDRAGVLCSQPPSSTLFPPGGHDLCPPSLLPRGPHMLRTHSRSPHRHLVRSGTPGAPLPRPHALQAPPFPERRAVSPLAGLLAPGTQALSQNLLSPWGGKGRLPRRVVSRGREGQLEQGGKDRIS